MERADTCVIIPTYNNAATLAEVIASVAAYTPHIVVVNDGSTDTTQQVLESFPSIYTISYFPNRGKGWAIRKAFDYAIGKGYRYAITIDADGQHFARDLPVFFEAVGVHEDAFIIGNRYMAHTDIPGGSTFGRRFSNFWFRLETGINCPDTQSGFRLYPIARLHKMHFMTRKYEFEIEVLVKGAWKGLPVLSVPVSVYYPPVGQRVTHFRPFKDFTRISLLNTALVLIAFLYIKPRKLFFTSQHTTR